MHLAHRLLRLAFLAIVLLSALTVRIPGLDDPLFKFGATRQYRSALIARSFFVASQEDAPAWRKEVARANLTAEGLLEPPVVEWLVSLAYRIAGRENPQIPRLLSIGFWLAGGVLVALVARRVSDGAAIVSLGVHCLLPFAVLASSSFQPDPLVVAMQTAGTLLILRFHERPTKERLAAAVAVSALAVLLKPVSFFQLAGAIGLPALLRRREGGTARLALIAAAGAFMLVPAAVFYVWGLLSGSLVAQAQMSFQPGLILTADFWLGWLRLIGATAGYVTVAAALAGVFLCRDRTLQHLLAGMWVGYLVFGLVFTYHIHTHDYYHLQLLPLAAISIAPLADRLLCVIDRWLTQPALLLASGTLGIAILVGPVAQAVAERAVVKIDGRLFFEAAVAPEIGRRVQHSARTIVLALDSGKALFYNAEIAGVAWPHINELARERAFGGPVPETRERLESLVAEYRSEYFVVTDLAELDNQPELARLLADSFALRDSTSAYRVFDLRRQAGNRSNDDRARDDDQN